MLFSCLLSAGAADLAEFRAKQKGLLNLLYVLAALGVLTIVFGLFAVPRILPEGRRLYFFSGFYCGGGAGLTASAAWNIRRLRRTLRDETALRRAFTEQTDERNAMITNRAARAAGLEPRFHRSGGGSDANVLAARGVRPITLGVGMASFHSADEHIAVADLEGTARLVEALIAEGVE